MLPAAGVLPGATELSYDSELILSAIPGGVFMSISTAAPRSSTRRPRDSRMDAGRASGQSDPRCHSHHRPDGSPYPVDECPIHRALIDGEPVRRNPTLRRRMEAACLVSSTCRPSSGSRALSVCSGFRDLSEKQRAEERTSQLIREQLRAREYQHAQLRDLLAGSSAHLRHARAAARDRNDQRALLARDRRRGRASAKAYREAFRVRRPTSWP